MKKIQKLNLDDDKKREAIKLQLTKDNENMSLHCQSLLNLMIDNDKG